METAVLYPSDGSVTIELTFSIELNFQGDDTAVNTVLKKEKTNSFSSIFGL